MAKKRTVKALVAEKPVALSRTILRRSKVKAELANGALTQGVLGALKTAPIAPIAVPIVSGGKYASYAFAFVAGNGSKAYHPTITVGGKLHTFKETGETIMANIGQFDNLPIQARSGIEYALAKGNGLKTLQPSVAGGYANKLQIGVTKSGEKWQEFIAFQDNTLFFKNSYIGFPLAKLQDYAKSVSAKFTRNATHWTGWTTNAIPSNDSVFAVIDKAFELAGFSANNL